MGSVAKTIWSGMAMVRGLGSVRARLAGADARGKWMTHRRVLLALVSVGGLGMVVKFAAMARDLVVARFFGIGDALDAFLIAFALPSFAIGVVAGALPAALIPVYLQVQHDEGADSAQWLFGTVSAGVLLLLGVTAVALAGLEPWLLPLVAAGFGEEKLALTRSLFYWMLPGVVLAGASVTFTAVLNAGRRYVLPALVPLAAPAATVVALLGFGHQWGVHAIAAGTLVGFTLEVLLLGFALRASGLRALPRLRMHPAAGRVMRQYLPMIVGAAVMTAAGLIDQMMAATLPAGSVAVLAFGNKLVWAVLSVGTVALSTVVFPEFARTVARGDGAGLRRALNGYTVAILLLCTPLVVVGALMSEEIVRLLFQGGAFSTADTRLVASVQALYFLQVPFYLASILGVRLLSATGGNHLLMWISIGNLVVNVVGNLILRELLGVRGIALSTTLVYALSSATVYWIARRRIRGL